VNSTSPPRVPIERQVKALDDEIERKAKWFADLVEAGRMTRGAAEAGLEPLLAAAATLRTVAEHVGELRALVLAKRRHLADRDGAENGPAAPEEGA